MDLKIHTHTIKSAHNCQSEEVVDLIFSVDGMLGRCEAAPLTEVYTYDVTPATVQRFRILLQRLAHRGKCNNVTIATAHITVAMVIKAPPRAQHSRIQSEAQCV